MFGQTDGLLYLSRSLSPLPLADRYVNAFKMNEDHMQDDFTGTAEILLLIFFPIKRLNLFILCHRLFSLLCLVTISLKSNEQS